MIRLLRDLLMKKHTSKPDNSQSSQEPPGFWALFNEGFREERKKGWLVRGFFRQQKAMAISDRQARFFSEAKEAARSVRNLKVAPTRVETFEAAVARQGLSDEFLYGQMQRHKWVHLGMYLLAGVLLLYAFWMVLNGGGLLSFGVVVAACGIAVNGYIHGFRAWQIENRSLIRFQDALRNPRTYLVL